MTKVVVNKTVDDEGLRALMKPRDDLVVERSDGENRFVLDTGPFDRYVRTVESSPRGDGGYDVEETTDFKLAIPVWGWMFVPIVKSAIRKPPEGDEPPWWSPPDIMDARASRILSFLCVFSAIAGFVGVLLSQTNTYFKQEFGATDTQISDVAIAVRIAALLALAITFLADRRGRRSVLMFATYLAIISTAAGAVSPNLWWLGTTQTVARACSAAIVVLIGIMAVEEVPAGSRAFSVSVMTMTAALGAGGVVLFLQVGEMAPWAWRIFFALPLLFLLVMPKLRKVVPETRRFEVYEARELHVEQSRSDEQASGDPTAGQSSGGEAIRPVHEHHHVKAGVVGIDSRRRRFAALGSTALLFAVFFTPASFYMNEWLRAEHGFSGGMISLFQVTTNVPLGGLALVIGGRLADRHGRRLIGAIGVAGGVGFTVLMYVTSGWTIWVFSALATAFGAMSVPALGVYGPELFSTSNRGASNGGLNVLGVVGSVIGLKGAAWLAEAWGGYSHAMPWLGIGPLLVVGVILVFYPETADVELEELNPEDVPPPCTLADLEELEHDLDEALEQASHEHGTHHLLRHARDDRRDRETDEHGNDDPGAASR